MTPQNAIKLQKSLAEKVITKTTKKTLQRICAVDTSYKGCFAFSSAIIYDKKQNNVIEKTNSKTKSTQPYISGLFMLKESGPIFSVLKKLKKSYDIILVDGNGQLHPRYCGLACYVGLKSNTPTVGVAKRLLCGKIKGNKVFVGKRHVGNIIQKGNKKIYISVGNKISLAKATNLIYELIQNDYWYPEPLRIADSNSKKFRKNQI